MPLKHFRHSSCELRPKDDRDLVIHRALTGERVVKSSMQAGENMLEDPSTAKNLGLNEKLRHDDSELKKNKNEQMRTWKGSSQLMLAIIRRLNLF